MHSHSVQNLISKYQGHFFVWLFVFVVLILIYSSTNCHGSRKSALRVLFLILLEGNV